MGEALQYFKDQTSIEVIQRLNAYKAMAQDILSNIEAKERFYELTLGSTISKFTAMQKYTGQSSAIRQSLLDARETAGLNQDYLNGYRLLNEIGHAFNGDWGYSLTIDSGGGKITFHMNEEQFLTLGEAHLGGFKLITAKSSILQKMADAQIEGIKWNNEDQRYNLQAYKNYTNAIEYAKGIITHAKDSTPIANYNKGQILEGYFAFLDKRSKYTNVINYLQAVADQVGIAPSEHLGYGYGKLKQNLQRIAADLRAQTNTRGFWSGGDTASEGQVKGEGASMFQFSTIRNQLSKFIQISDNLHFERLEEAMAQARPRAKQALEKKLQEALSEVMSQFNATTVSIADSASLTKQAYGIQSEIDSIINSLI